MNPQVGRARHTGTTTVRPRLSAKPAQFTESVIREMTRLAIEYGAVNLSQGFIFPLPDIANRPEGRSEV